MESGIGIRRQGWYFFYSNLLILQLFEEVRHWEIRFWWGGWGFLFIQWNCSRGNFPCTEVGLGILETSLFTVPQFLSSPVSRPGVSKLWPMGESGPPPVLEHLFCKLRMVCTFLNGQKMNRCFPRGYTKGQKTYKNQSLGKGTLKSQDTVRYHYTATKMG